MTEWAAAVAALAALSLTVTKVVDFLRNLFDKEGKMPKWAISLAALVIGVAFCLGWQLNLTGTFASLVPALAEKSLDGVSGEILTGLAVGAGAGFFHELLDALSGIAAKNHAAAEGGG